jgi:hypothetical protein
VSREVCGVSGKTAYEMGAFDKEVYAKGIY